MDKLPTVNDFLPSSANRAQLGSKSAEQSQTSSTHATTFSEYEKDASIYFFKRLKNIYLGKFDTQFKTPDDVRDARREWAQDIGRLSHKQIDDGLASAKKKYKAGATEYQWPNVALIIGLAVESSEEGIANVMQAYKEATDNYGRPGHSTWSHMVVYTAAKATGSHLLREGKERESLPIFKSNFEEALTKFRNGDTLDAIPALPKPEDVKPRTTRKERNESAQKHLKDIKGLFE